MPRVTKEVNDMIKKASKSDVDNINYDDMVEWTMAMKIIFYSIIILFIGCIIADFLYKYIY